MLSQNSFCMSCEQRSNNYKKQKLLRIREFVMRSKVNPVKGNYRFLWEIAASCKRGISCPYLLSYTNECDQIARVIEPYIVGIAKSGNEKIIRELLNLLQGDFALVYRLVIRIYEDNAEGLCS